MQELNPNSREADNRWPVIHPGFRDQLSPNLLERLQPYQVMYNTVMLQLERLMAFESVGGSASSQIEEHMQLAEHTRTEAERVVGINRETRGRIQEYPMTPNEAFGAYQVGVDTHRTGYEVNETSLSVWHTRADGTREQVFPRPEPRGIGIFEQLEPNRVTYDPGNLSREQIEEAFREVFEARPRQRQVRIYPSPAASEQIMEAMRRETEQMMWYGSSTQKQTRRDKKKVVSTSIYWEYQPFD